MCTYEWKSESNEIQIKFIANSIKYLIFALLITGNVCLPSGDRGWRKMLA